MESHIPHLCSSIIQADTVSKEKGKCDIELSTLCLAGWTCDKSLRKVSRIFVNVFIMGQLFDRDMEIYWWKSVLEYNKKDNYFILYMNKTLSKAKAGRGLKSRLYYIQGIHGSA